MRKLPSDNELYKLLSYDNTSDENKERIVRVYNKKGEYLCEFQNWADIWTYSYLKHIK